MRLALSGILALIAVTALVRRADAACNPIQCGFNAPIIGPYEIVELDGGGGYNAQGLKVIGMKGPDGTPCWPDVHQSFLRGVDTNGTVLFEHSGLQGATIQLEDRNSPPNHFQILVAHVTEHVPFWVGANFPEATRTETYQLEYSIGFNTTDTRPVCSSEPSQPTWEFGEHYDNTKEAVLFNGDRYDADAIAVTQTTVAGSQAWFNFGCAGSALYKMLLTRHATAGAWNIFQAGWWEKQSMLKMLTADACGDGHSFTQQGAPLYWNNADNWGVEKATQFKVEALWSPYGMVCFDHEHSRLDGLYLDEINACLANQTPPLVACDVRFPSFPTIWPLTLAYVVSTLPAE